MNQQPDPTFDQRIADWLEEDPDRAPPAALETVLAAYPSIPQRGGWRVPWRLPALNRFALVAAPVAIVAIALAVGVVVVPHLDGGTGGSPPSATPTFTPIDPDTGWMLPGPQGPGVFHTQKFAVQVRFTLPAGWGVSDDPGVLQFSYPAAGSYRYPDGTDVYDRIAVFRRPVAESNIEQKPLAGIGSTADELADWLAGHVDLVASAPVPVRIGGADGYRLEISLPSEPRVSPDHCIADHGQSSCESLFVSGAPSALYEFGLVGPESALIYLLDVSQSRTVMVVIDDVDGVDRDGFIAAATPIVESFGFVP